MRRQFNPFPYKAYVKNIYGITGDEELKVNADVLVALFITIDKLNDDLTFVDICRDTRDDLEQAIKDLRNIFHNHLMNK